VLARVRSEALQKKWNLDDGAFAKARSSDGVCKRL